MRVLTLQDTYDLLDMPMTLEALESAYRDLGEGNAANVGRADLLSPGPLPGSFHGFKTMSGSLPRRHVSALRLNSDIVTWPLVNGQPRRVKVPRAPGNKWVGLVMLFSHDTGEPLAIFPDGFVQRMRVGGSGGLSVKYMARPDASVMAVIGSGWQAGSAVLATCAVRPITEVRVYSPDPEHRRAFAERMTEEAGVEVVPVASPEAACRGAAVVSCTTNALHHVAKADWIEPGMHLTCVRTHEYEPAAYAKCHRIVVNCRVAEPEHVIIGGAGDIAELSMGWKHPGYERFDWSTYPELGELVAGKLEGRRGAEDITCFNNTIGLGVQFAAVGASILDRAEKEDRGHKLPLDWFLQDVHP
ncbi:MAG TPA: ornithine cyclodeaminase family protein [Chloroflexota bacterium]